MTAHKGEVHPGQHPPIVDEDLWKAVQERLEANRNGHKTKSHAADPSLLSGKLVDELGRRLIPSHTRKGNKRYRYYVTPVDEPGDPIRLPANEIEQLVVKAVKHWAGDKKQVVDAVGWGDAKVASDAITAGQQLAQALALNAREHISNCVEAVEIGPGCVRIALDLVSAGIIKPGMGAEITEIEVPAERKRCGMAVRLIVAGPHEGPRKAEGPDPTLIALMEKARNWLQRLTKEGLGIGEIAQQESVSTSYVTRMLHLALLAPDLAQAISVGDHPADLKVTRLMNAMPLPMDWGEQRAVLGWG